MPSWLQKKDEFRWEYAKRIVEDEYGPFDDGEQTRKWKLVMAVFKKLGGTVDKSLEPLVLRLIKSYVRGHYRTLKDGSRVWVRPYTNRKTRKADEPDYHHPIGKRLRQIAAKAARQMRPLQVPAMEIKKDWTGQPLEQSVGDPRRLWNLQTQKVAGTDNVVFVGIREAFQNSLDAMFEAMRRGEIKRGEFRVDYDVNAGTLSISDNGIGMDEDTFRTKFMVLGETGKAGQTEAVGGFGMAKAYILGMVDPSLPGARWTVRTRDIEATSEMADPKTPPAERDIKRGLPNQQGVVLKFEGIEKRAFGWNLEEKLSLLLGLTDTGGKVDMYLNGKQVQPPFTVSEDCEKPLDSPMVPEGTNVRCYLPEGDRPRAITRLKSKYGYTMLQTIEWSGNLPCFVVMDIDTKWRPGDPEYPYEDSRLHLKYDSPLAKLMEAVTTQLKMDPYSATSKSEYQTQVFGATGGAIIDEQDRQAKRAIATDPTMMNATKEVAEILRNVGAAAAPHLSERDESDPTASNIRAASMASRIIGLGRSDDSIQYAGTSPIGRSFVVRIANGYEAGEKFRIDKTALRQLIAWDSICRIVGAQLIKVGALMDVDFKPGFVLKGDIKAMNTKLEYDQEIAERIGVPRERVLLFNPLFVKGDSPEARAMWMRDEACHEFAHFFCGMHTEEFTAAESNVREATLPVIGDILRIGKLLLRTKAKQTKPDDGSGRLELSLKSILEGNYAIR